MCRSIRVRMTLAFALTISLLMLLACGGLLWYGQWAAERKADALLASTLAKVRTDLTDNAPGFDASDLQEDARLSGMALWVGGPNGRTLFQSQPGALPYRSGADWRVMVRSDGLRTVVLGLPWRETRQAIHHQAALLVLLGLFVTAAATVGAWVVVGRTLSPIGALSRQAQAASAEGLPVRLAAPSQDAEIVGLVTTLNELLARIADTVAAKGRFHAAASHELRTPLQVLSGRLELALHRDRSKDEYRRCIEEAGVYAQRLVALARDLLLLHHLDGARPPGSTEVDTEVDLAATCRRALDDLQPRLRERGLHVEADLGCEVWQKAVPSHAEMLVRNLLENAVNYAIAGGHVRIDLCAGDGSSQLTVENEFSGQPDDDPQRWLEPFQGRDTARRAGEAGTGLGLAICTAIAQANGWTLTLEAERGRVCARVRFGGRS